MPRIRNANSLLYIVVYHSSPQYTSRNVTKTYYSLTDLLMLHVLACLVFLVIWLSLLFLAVKNLTVVHYYNNKQNHSLIQVCVTKSFHTFSQCLDY